MPFNYLDFATDSMSGAVQAEMYGRLLCRVCPIMICRARCVEQNHMVLWEMDDVANLC